MGKSATYKSAVEKSTVGLPAELQNATNSNSNNLLSSNVAQDRIGHAHFDLQLTGHKSAPDQDYLTIHYHSCSSPMYYLGPSPVRISPRTVTVLPSQGGAAFIGSRIEFDHFYLPRRLLRKAVNAFDERELNEKDLRPVIGHFNNSFATHLETTALRMKRLTGNRLSCETVAHNLVEGFLLFLGTLREAPQKRRRLLTSANLRNVVELVEAELGEDLSLERLARASGMEVFWFLRCFSDQMGMTPHQYVLSRRVHRAIRLLEFTSNSIADIAYEVGFSSQSHMTTRMQTTMGKTPAVIRSGKG